MLALWAFFSVAFFTGKLILQPGRIYADEKKACVLKPPRLPSSHVLSSLSSHLGSPGFRFFQ